MPFSLGVLISNALVDSLGRQPLVIYNRQRSVTIHFKETFLDPLLDHIAALRVRRISEITSKFIAYIRSQIFERVLHRSSFVKHRGLERSENTASHILFDHSTQAATQVSFLSGGRKPTFKNFFKRFLVSLFAWWSVCFFRFYLRYFGRLSDLDFFTADFRSFDPLSAWFHSFATDDLIPTFFANFGLCAAAAIKRACAGDLLGIFNFLYLGTDKLHAGFVIRLTAFFDTIQRVVNSFRVFRIIDIKRIQALTEETNITSAFRQTKGRVILFLLRSSLLNSGPIFLGQTTQFFGYLSLLLRNFSFFNPILGGNVIVEYTVCVSALQGS